MTARDIIAYHLAPDHPQFADEILDALKAAGYRILAPGDLDKVTLERCIAAIDAARQLPIHTASVERVNGVRQGHDRSVAAIRSLGGGET